MRAGQTREAGLQHAVKFMEDESEREEAYKLTLERILGQRISNIALEAREGIFRTRLTILSASKVTVLPTALQASLFLDVLPVNRTVSKRMPNIVHCLQFFLNMGSRVTDALIIMPFTARVLAAPSTLLSSSLHPCPPMKNAGWHVLKTPCLLPHRM